MIVSGNLYIFRIVTKGLWPKQKIAWEKILDTYDLEGVFGYSKKTQNLWSSWKSPTDPPIPPIWWSNQSWAVLK